MSHLGSRVHKLRCRLGPDWIEIVKDMYPSNSSFVTTKYLLIVEL